MYVSKEFIFSESCMGFKFVIEGIKGGLARLYLNTEICAVYMTS